MSKYKVLLINPAPDYDKEIHKSYDISMGVGMPWGLLLLASILDQNGYSVRIIDGQITDCQSELVSELKDDHVVCIGLSVMSSQYLNAIALSQLVKNRNASIPVVWGGFHPTIFPTETLNNSVVDYVITGEADEAFLQLCIYLLHGGTKEEIGNLAYRENGEIKLNTTLPLSDFASLPVLNYDLLDHVEWYIKKTNPLGQSTRMLGIIAGLGCNFSCSFCHNAIYRKRHRIKSADEIVNEMNSLHSQYGINEFCLVDENFFADRERIERFLQLLAQNKNKFTWSSSLRASYVSERYLNPEMLKRIADAGGYYFGVGAESGSNFIIHKLRKGIKKEDVLNLARWTRDVGMDITYSFIAGIPGETCEMTLETLRFIETIKQINPKSKIIGPQIFRPYPGSPLYYECLKEGMKGPVDWNDAADFLRTLSQFRKIDVANIPWLKEPYKFKYMMLTFYLLSIQRKLPFPMNVALRTLQHLARKRIRTGNFSYLLEKPALDFLNTKLT